jgi:hypothetical protein
MKRALALAAALTMYMPSLALAQNSEINIANPTSIVDNVQADDIKSLVTEMGAREAQVRDGDNNKIVTFLDGKLPYTFGITGCEIRPGKCLSLVMLVFIDMGASGISTDMINSRNKDSFFNTAIRIDDKVIAFGRGVIVDGGITRRNLATNIVVYAAMVHDGIKHFGSQIVASSGLPGTTQNLSLQNGTLRPVFPTPQQLNTALKAYDARLKSANAQGRSWSHQP